MSDRVHGTTRIALLIDADNAQPCIVRGLLAEITRYGVADVKRIYGDWTTPNLIGWKEVLLEYSLHPVQQFRYAQGKNATDSAMIIDAMDLLYTRRFDGFCLVSSDSDFSRLASRVREEGLLVLGFGEKKTPVAFQSACSTFVFTEDLRERKAQETATVAGKQAANTVKGNEQIIRLLRDAVEAASESDGWANLGAVGSNIQKRAPEFTPRAYGHKRLGDLIVAVSLFDTEKRGQDGRPKALYVRNRRKRVGE